jgi:hypothetical protein
MDEIARELHSSVFGVNSLVKAGLVVKEADLDDRRLARQAEGEPRSGRLERLVAAVRALHRALSRSAHFARLVDQEARVESPRLAYLYELMAPWLDGIKPLFTRLVERGVLRPMPWYLFHFLITAPSSLYSQPPLARRVGRPDDADDHDLMTDLVFGGCSARGALLRRTL